MRPTLTKTKGVPKIPLCRYCGQWKKHILLMPAYGVANGKTRMLTPERIPFDYSPCNACKRVGVGVVIRDYGKAGVHAPTQYVLVNKRTWQTLPIKNLLRQLGLRVGFVYMDTKAAASLGILKAIQQKRRTK